MKKGLFLIILIMLFPITINGAYNYSPLQDVIASAEAVIAEKIIDSTNIANQDGVKVTLNLGELVDICGFENRVFICDRSNNCIYVLNENYQYITTFGNSEGPGKLNKPNGIFVTKDYIYIADTENFRIAIYNHDYNFINEIANPDDPTFKSIENEKGYEFKPLKVTVDRTGRVYVVANQIFEGIIDFNPDGSFSRYVGANTVSLSLWDAFWLRFTTEEQRKAQGYRLASTFVNLNVDENGYLYTVSTSEQGSTVIKKLNYKGDDVLPRNGYVVPVGDVLIANYDDNLPSATSELIDIDINEYGNYIVLDETKGRIFTYDFEGNLLYIGGNLAKIGGKTYNIKSLFLQPEALCYYQDKILVVDSLNKNIIVFGFSEFANLVNEATNYYFQGDYQNAKEKWNQVLKLNTNYFLAYAGIGKAQYFDKEYEPAMKNLKLGFSDYYYSKAYKQYRYQKMNVVAPYIIGITIIGVIYLLIKSIKNSIDKQKEDENW